MAKNYTLAEASKVIAEGKDYEALQDIGRRFPLLMNKMTKLVTLAPEAVEIFGYMPDYLTANKINKAIKEEKNFIHFFLFIFISDIYFKQLFQFYTYPC